MPEQKSYKIGDDTFDIPESEVSSFLKDNPGAKEVQSYTVGKDTLDIPVAEVPDFLKDMPDAKPLKKKDETSAPSLSGQVESFQAASISAPKVPQAPSESPRQKLEKTFGNIPLVGQILKERLPSESATSESETGKSELQKTNQGPGAPEMPNVELGGVAVAATGPETSKTFDDAMAWSFKNREVEQAAAKAQQDLRNTQGKEAGYDFVQNNIAVKEYQDKSKDLNDILSNPTAVPLQKQAAQAELQQLTEQYMPQLEKAQAYSDLYNGQVANLEAKTKELEQWHDKNADYYTGTVGDVMRTGARTAKALVGVSDFIYSLAGIAPAGENDWVNKAIAGTEKNASGLVQPKGILGEVISGTVSAAEMIAESVLAPEVKLIGNFIPLLATKNFGESYHEKHNVGEAAMAGLEGAKEGAALGIYGKLGGIAGQVVGKEIGALAPKAKGFIDNATANVLDKTTSAIVMASGLATQEQIEEYIRTGHFNMHKAIVSGTLGLTLGAKDVFEAAHGKAVSDYMTASPEAINQAMNLKLDFEAMRKMSGKLMEEARKAEDPQEKMTLIGSALATGKIANWQGITRQLIANPNYANALKEDIQNSDLPPEQKQQQIAKIDQLINDNDPRIKAAKPIEDEIALLQKGIEQNNQAQMPELRRAEMNEMSEAKVKELTEQAKKIYSTPLEVFEQEATDKLIDAGKNLEENRAIIEAEHKDIADRVAKVMASSETFGPEQQAEIDAIYAEYADIRAGRKKKSEEGAKGALGLVKELKSKTGASGEPVTTAAETPKTTTTNGKESESGKSSGKENTNQNEGGREEKVLSTEQTPSPEGVRKPGEVFETSDNAGTFYLEVDKNGENIPITKTVYDAKKNQQGLPSGKPQEQAPVEKEPITGTGKEATGTGGNVQKNGKITATITTGTGKKVRSIEREYTPKKVGEVTVFVDNRGAVVRERYDSGGLNPRYAEIMDAHVKNTNFDTGERADVSDYEGATEGDMQRIDEDFVKRTNNPAELAEVYYRNLNNREANTLDGIDATLHAMKFKVNRKSYIRFGDKNNITQSKAFAYFDKTAPGVDQIAQDASKLGDRITTGDVIKYIDKFYNGHPSEKWINGESPISNDAQVKFEKLTGLKLTDKIAESIIDKEAKRLNVKENANELDKYTDEQLEQLASERELSDVDAAKIYEAQEPGVAGEVEGTPSVEEKTTEPEEIKPTEPVKEEPVKVEAKPVGPPKSEPVKAEKKSYETVNEVQEKFFKGELKGKEYLERLEAARQNEKKDRQSKDRGDMSQTEKAYEDIAGLAPITQTGRIPVAPIVGGKAKNLSKIMFDIGKGLKQRILYSRMGKKTLGTYSPGNSAVKIKFNGDLDTTAHELGHSIDDLFGVLTDLNKTPDLAIEAELGMFSPFGSKPKASTKDPQQYVRAEGFAEFLRALIVNPELTKTAAPKLFELYEKKVSPEYRKELERFSEDVRTWAGSSGRDMTMANVRMEPKPEPNIISEVLSKKNPDDQVSLSFGDRVAANWVNPMKAIEKSWEIAKGIKGVDEVLPSKNPLIGARLLLGSDGKVGQMLNRGITNGKNEILRDAKGNVKNLKWLIEPLDNIDEATIKKEQEDVVAYMISKRAESWAEKFGRRTGLTGVGGGVYRDVDVAKKTIDELKNGDPAKYARIKEAAKRYQEFSDDILKYMVDKGRLSKDAYAKIKAGNLEYVAMQRVMETEPGREIEMNFGSSGVLGNKVEPLKKAKGSTKEIVNPYSSLIDTLFKSIKEADRNEVLLNFRDMIQQSRGMYEGDVEKLSQIGVQGKQGDKHSIPIFVDGKAEHWIFHEDVYNSLKGLDGEAYRLPGIVTALPSLLRASVTNFPIFAARNIVRDVQDRLIKSTDNSGFTDLFGNKEHWDELARTGGLNSGYYMKNESSYYGLMESAIRESAKNKNTIWADGQALKRGWEGYKNILGKSETLNRVAEYRAAYEAAKAKGMSDYDAGLYAGYKSRDLMDFALMGHYMKVVNQLIPFSNAAIQGTRTAVNSARANPGKFAMNTIIYSVIPQAMLWAINHRDEKTAKEYEALPAHQRDMAWNLKIGENKWLAIPKPFELGLFGSGIDRGLSHLYGNKESYKGYAGTVAKSLFPFDESSFAGPFQGMVEASTNYDYFRDKYIVPPSEDALDLSLRNTDNASRLGQALQKIAGIDARKIDHMIGAQFSYFGNAAKKLSDIGTDNGPKFELSDLGFFKSTPAYNSPQVQDMLDYAKKWGLSNSATMKDFAKVAKVYFDSKTDKEKDQRAGELRDYAGHILAEWKATNADEIKLAKHEAKKNKDEAPKSVQAEGNRPSRYNAGAGSVVRPSRYKK